MQGHEVEDICVECCKILQNGVIIEGNRLFTDGAHVYRGEKESTTWVPACDLRVFQNLFLLRMELSSRGDD